MDEVEVEVVDAPVGELAAGDGLDVGAGVEGVPEFGGDEEVAAGYDAFGYGAGDSCGRVLADAGWCVVGVMPALKGTASMSVETLGTLQGPCRVGCCTFVYLEAGNAQSEKKHTFTTFSFVPVVTCPV